MLVISRKAHESFLIEPVDGLDPSLTLQEVFEGHPIVLRLVHVGQQRVRLAIDAPTRLKVWRGPPTSSECESAAESGASAAGPNADVGASAK